MALFLGGCAAFGGSKAPPPTYDLTVPQSLARGGQTVRGQLMIPEATAISPLDSEKIIVRPSAGEVTAMANAQWSDRLPKLVQARAVQAFENANLMRAVGRPGDHLAADYQLLLDIRAFNIAVAGGAAAQVEISAKLVNDKSGRIIAARIFRISVPAAAAEGPSAVAALDAAFTQFSTALIAWTTKVV